MKHKLSTDPGAEPASVVQRNRVTLERLSADAERLKMISELQTLQRGRVEVSVDTRELLESTRTQQERANGFATLDEMMLLLRLMATQSDAGPVVSTPTGPAGFINKL